MSTLLINGSALTSKKVTKRSCVLRSKENISKLKCNKSLKRKLKKYKLRKDGQEDPDIIDVSQTLITSLTIKSPNNPTFFSHKVSEENKPYNYLTKMVRMKKNISGMESAVTNFPCSKSESKEEPISLTLNCDQEKKHTDAFKLLMDSRNRSIGGNSPGKEKCEDDFEVQVLEQKKLLKAKRILSLKKMAEAKGFVQNMDIEEYREEAIKRKLKIRKNKFKDMIGNMEAKNDKKDKFQPLDDKLIEKSTTHICSKTTENIDSLNRKTPLFKMFDVFKDVKEMPNSSVNKISKEDEDFLNKLSPSIRKKENMLCYFQKINKDLDIQEDGNTISENKEQLVIKVKCKYSNKVKKRSVKNYTEKKQKLQLNVENQDQKLQHNSNGSVRDNKKRKLNGNMELDEDKIVKGTTLGEYNNSIRPKRNTKKPVKYTDEFLLTSSDEDLHIFTPKKRRKIRVTCESNLESPKGNNTKEVVKIDHPTVIDKHLKNLKTDNKKVKNRNTKLCKKNNQKQESTISSTKKTTKLAPIFRTKPPTDPAAFEAKQKFLQSGVPSQLKKSTIHQSNMLASDEFLPVVHVQNLSGIDIPRSYYVSNTSNTNNTLDIKLKEERDLFNKLLQVPLLQNNMCMPKLQKNVDEILQNLKNFYPKFPVYRTYHLLRGKSKGQFKDCIYPDLDNSLEILNNVMDTNNTHPDKLHWADKYKPTTEKQVIGNFDSIKELRQWLVSWTENNAKLKRSKEGSDLSDFDQSDTDSREALKNENNLLIITGKVGTGKTLSVYAVAAELAIKVIEVNASAKRTGKIILQDLQEATQSHKVDRGKNGTDSSQKSQEENSSLLKTIKKRGRKRKDKVNSLKNNTIIKKESTELTVIQDSIRTGMSLILIDDADIVFEQDDGFCYAISQLIQSSKRPVILVTSSLTCPHLQKFSCAAKVIKMQPFLPRMLGTWLDIMCLVDGNMCSPGLGAKTLDLFKGDIRKTINYLQFYMRSHKNLSDIDDSEVLQKAEILKGNVDEESSCMSWGENEVWSEKNIGSYSSSDTCNYFMTKESYILHFMGPLNNFYVWWNLPNLLNYSLKHSDHASEKLNKSNKFRDNEALNNIATVLDNMSMTDCIGVLADEPNITSRPLQSFEKDSVIDNENLAIYDRVTECLNEISWDLMIKGIAESQRFIDTEVKIELEYPSMSIQRERDRVVSRHKTLTNCLNPSTSLDRRALALDYWSSCRNICRIEKTKTDNVKRNNRFCHYLKSLNIICKNDYFDNLGQSLHSKT